ncbi:hypothetical protein NADFUDRAFT_76897 [Nadsonia fulvescens var. elongata DSM 6958]|uniref:Micro-fibrillar-associated protein 1 C-terminal domain-containing protein n=1 Tax=Nadsonia fulvescens var. elongata DSM 6958 TaxID=857566 RepID=A0A1E3PTL7_9ASCO|nr:hypothetical protein NADFUDRAFT_76897 [Nadsonia fulvescens var. elongata DSM 6958]
MSHRSRPVRYWPGKKIGPESGSSDSEHEEYEYASDPYQPSSESLTPKDEIKKEDHKIIQSRSNLEGTLDGVRSNATIKKLVKAEINIKSESITSAPESLQHIKKEEIFQQIKAVSSEIEEKNNYQNEESSDEGSPDEESSDEEGSSQESSSDEEMPTLIRPVFINKKAREQTPNKASVGHITDDFDSDNIQRRERTLKTVEDSIRKEITMAESLKSLNEDLGNIDDTDGLDPEVEYNAWRLRELKRINRERELLELAEKEQDEIDRRRNLTEEERLKEDKTKLDLQDQQRKERKGNGASMNKYYHKGVFYQTEENKELFNRDYQSSANVDDYKDKSVLPEALQVRGGLIGLRGQTKYKGMKSEDTTVNRKDDLYQMAKSSIGSGYKRGPAQDNYNDHNDHKRSKD